MKIAREETTDRKREKNRDRERERERMIAGRCIRVRFKLHARGSDRGQVAKNSLEFLERLNPPPKSLCFFQRAEPLERKA